MKKNRRKYALCLMGLLSAVVAAFFSPQLFFFLQDSYRLQNMRQETRQSLDIEGLQFSYAQSVRLRMADLAQGLAEGKTYHTAATDYEIEESRQQEVLNDLQSFFYENTWFYPMSEWQYVIEAFNNQPMKIETCKKYVIYEEDFTNGAAIIAWYVGCTKDDGSYVKLLVDINEDIIYYMESSESIKEEELIKMGYEIGSWSHINKEILYYQREFYNDYYQGDYVGDEIYNEYAAQTADKLWQPVMNWEIPYDSCHIDFEADFWNEIDENGSMTCHSRMGVSQIGSLIPELER